MSTLFNVLLLVGLAAHGAGGATAVANSGRRSTFQLRHAGKQSLVTKAVTGIDQPSNTRPSQRLRMINTADAQYTGTIMVGGQSLQAVFDTGSFELLVFSSKCTSCGKKEHLYNSSTLQDRALRAEHNFGSGTTYSFEAYDTFGIGHDNVSSQVFWEVYNANMPILEEDNFQAIVGIGPPLSAIKFAQEDVDEVHKELEEWHRSKTPVTQTVQDTVAHYEELLVHAKTAKGIAKRMRLHNVSFCLGKASGSDGYFIWNDHEPRDHPEKFTTVEVVGDYYWSAALKNVRLHGDGVFMAGEVTDIGCQQEKCSAVIDTGTTLIMAPPASADRINYAISSWKAAGGNCNDVSKLPHLHFTMNGISFSLPPESYVGKVEGMYSPEVGKLLGSRKTLLEPALDECESLIMSMDVDSQLGAVWIFGMPFFRQYYSTFHFVEESGDKPPVAANMAFSVASEDCTPSGSVSENLIAGGIPKPRKAELNIDASKVRVPAFVLKAMEPENLPQLGVHMRPARPYVHI